MKTQGIEIYTDNVGKTSETHNLFFDIATVIISNG